jgi:hypothetical protein
VTIQLTEADRLDIIQLQSIFAWALDHRDEELFEQAFTEDFVALYPGGKSLEGRDKFVQFTLGVHESHDATQHFIANHWLDPQDDHVIMRSYIILSVAAKDTPGGDLFQGGANYVDKVVKTNEGWRIATREATRMWQGGNMEILLAGRREADAKV